MSAKRRKLTENKQSSMKSEDIDKTRNATDATEKLPDEVLLEIFGYLKHSDLVNNCLVSKRWDTVISESSLFLNKTRLKVTLHGGSEFQRKNYRHVQMTLMSKNLLYNLECIGNNLNSLFIETYKKLAVDDFIQLLKCATNLKSLRLGLLASVAGNNVNPKRPKVTMEQLSELECPPEIIQYIKCTKMTNLIINNYYPLLKLELVAQDIIEFLNELDELESLDLRKFLLVSTEKSPTWSREFPLKRLTLSYYDAGAIQVANRVDQHLEIWRNLIKLMCVDSIITIQFRFPERSLMHLLRLCSENKKIDNISLYCSGFQRTHEIGALNLELPQVKTLDIGLIDNENVRSTELFHLLLKLFPNIETLIILNIPAKQLDLSIIATFANLRCIHTSSPICCNLVYVSFPKLETLNLIYFEPSNLESLKRFTKNQKKLKHIKIDSLKGDTVAQAENICHTLYKFVSELETVEMTSPLHPKILRTRSEFENK